MEARGRGLALAAPRSLPRCGSPALGHGSPDPHWCPTPWSALQREEAVEGVLKGKLPQLLAGMWGGFPPPHIPAALGQWHLARAEDPGTSMMGTSIPQQIPSLPHDSSTLRLVPHHP